jgi:CubicO group peptidase (beta-lactamase class C family)
VQGWRSTPSKTAPDATPDSANGIVHGDACTGSSPARVGSSRRRASTGATRAGFAHAGTPATQAGEAPRSSLLHSALPATALSGTHAMRTLPSTITLSMGLSILLAPGCTDARPAAATTSSAAAPMEAAAVRHAGIEGYLGALVARGEFRGVVLVARGDRIVHRAAYGLANQDTATPNTTQTAFHIGSLTKSFTATTVMQLVEDGVLDLQAPISRYLPGLDKRFGDPLTLHLLLRQRSGLPGHLEDIAEQGDERVTSADILALINRAEPAFAPGSRHAYSNLNYHLAALAIEAATGKPFAEVLRERTFAPLGMSGSGIEGYANRAPHRARGYGRTLTGWENAENNMSYTLGSGDIHATADDLLRWSRALDDPAYLSNASRDAMFDGGGEADGWYGYGFRIQPYRRADGSTGRLVRHGGSMDGFLSNLHRYLDDDLTVIVLGNQRPFDVRGITRRLKQLALGMPVTVDKGE